MRTIGIASLMMAAALWGCGDDGHGNIEPGPPTGAECPPASTLTYENFADGFMESYCRRCHSESVTGADREGAPSDHNFDDLVAIRGMADHIDEMAGSGPDSTNEQMPPDGDAPTLEEREQLAEWLACGAPGAE
jgi:uncharacterized membrane protein